MAVSCLTNLSCMLVELYRGLMALRKHLVLALVLDFTTAATAATGQGTIIIGFIAC